MAATNLDLKIGSAEVCGTCESITFTEGTGSYNVSTNPLGWGTPNTVIGTITATHILITLPDGTTVVDIANPVGLPTTSTTFEYEITAAALNGGTKIADGLYQIEYTVTDGTYTYTAGPSYFLFTCNSQCCVNKLFAKIATQTDCSCNSTAVTNALYASALLNGLCASKDCGNISGMNSLISKLNQICNSTNCGCGC